MGRKKNLISRISIVLIVLTVSAFVACGSTVEDKHNMTEAEKKLSTDLLGLVEATKSQASTEPVANSEGQDLVYVYVYLYKGNNTNVIEPVVQEITDWDEENSVAVAWISINELEELASLEEVKNIRTVMPPVVNNSSATTKENASDSDGAEENNYVEDGSWIKLIGVMIFTAIIFKKRSK
ncbi:hypothetical protein [Methanomethylovorans sp.]|uniref:hypothetical protein n=1 Tax=Methanomethylovorans sp. TaxID=2758717 RepID=UPI00351C880F